MSRQDAIVLASRTLAALLTVWALTEASHLPEYIQSFFHYAEYEPTLATNLQYLQYWRQHYVIELGFLIVRIVGFSLTARWLFKVGPEVAELLLPVAFR